MLSIPLGSPQLWTFEQRGVAINIVTASLSLIFGAAGILAAWITQFHRPQAKGLSTPDLNKKSKEDKSYSHKPVSPSWILGKAMEKLLWDLTDREKKWNINQTNAIQHGITENLPNWKRYRHNNDLSAEENVLQWETWRTQSVPFIRKNTERWLDYST